MPINRKYDMNHHYFASISTCEKAYWLGWLWSDGHVREQHGSYYIKLALQKGDEDILQQFKSAVEAEYPILTDRNAVQICLVSKQMFGDLQRYGVIPHKSLLATFPNIERDFLSDFIRGVFDGDGCLTIVRPRVVTIIGTETFCSWLQTTTRQEIGIRSAVYHKKNTTFRWVINAQEMIRTFAQWIYQANKNGSLPIRLERKYARFASLALV